MKRKKNLKIRKLSEVFKDYDVDYEILYKANNKFFSYSYIDNLWTGPSRKSC